MNEVPVHLLRETLQARVPAGPPEACLDAETVAAWADDTLGRDERRAAEAHLADCGRCQALVAAMARTAPAAAGRPWWRRPIMGWLVPLTAAAAALLVWTIVPGTPTAPSSPLVSPAIEQGPAGRAQAAAPNPQTQPQPQSRLLTPPKQQEAKERAGTANAGGANAPSVAAATSAIEAPPALAKALPESAGGAAAAPAPSTAPPAAPTPPPLAVDSVGGPTTPVTVQPTAALRFRAAIGQGLVADARRSPAVILSPNASSQWRILPDGAVQHSTDSGSTWAAQSTGVTAMLTAGASPAPSICWLVGREGVVLLSTDGRSWRRVVFPEATDLASILAIDDKSATVTAVDGRAFRTTDGGQTWTR